MKAFVTIPVLLLSALVAANPVVEESTNLAPREAEAAPAPEVFEIELEKRKKGKSSGSSNSSSAANTLEVSLQAAGVAAIGGAILLLN